MDKREESSLIQHHLQVGRQMIQDLLNDAETVQTLIDELDSDSDEEVEEVEETTRQRPNIDRDRYDFHDKLMADYLNENARYSNKDFS
ncbi:hypothetical protein PtA15_18A369 [Puccinia triticina]|uniref:Uncharacterized protein n=1 Tax=Puccinia triticina TaxID=208348 RepID=A0ABY7D944_9BASI|nr:uncharacterized protein PtA15_18A369 [Puccinia triticina]WAQ93309.1 hypothetical protein PtA15_18A369 [Puccinia triticina]WAR63298.1 hypothetical protein PtB15_18B381 [Puccinia triticina]